MPQNEYKIINLVKVIYCLMILISMHIQCRCHIPNVASSRAEAMRGIHLNPANACGPNCTLFSRRYAKYRVFTPGGGTWIAPHRYTGSPWCCVPCFIVKSIYENYWHNLKQIATEFFSAGMHSGEVSLEHTKNPLRHLWGKQVKSAIKVTFSH